MRKIKTLLLAVVVLLALLLSGCELFFSDNSSYCLDDYKDSEYFPLIEVIDEYRIRTQKKQVNSDAFTYSSNDDNKSDASIQMLSAELASTPSMGPDESYVDFNENRPESIDEPDIVKFSDKYIFSINSYGIITIYSNEKENSTVVSTYQLPHIMEDMRCWRASIYLSDNPDILTAVVVYEEDFEYVTCLMLLDISDIKNISVKKTVSFNGLLSSCSTVNGKTILVTAEAFEVDSLNYSDPSTFVPSITVDGITSLVRLDDVIYPEKINNISYGVTTLLDESNLEVLDVKAVLNNSGSIVYTSENNVYLIGSYNIKDSDGVIYHTSENCDIAILNHRGNELVDKGTITLRGYVRDKSHIDENNGYIRIVTTNLERRFVAGESYDRDQDGEINLYVFSLDDNSPVAKIENFAEKSKTGVVVRFRGDSLYVCNSELVNFKEPVYHLDLKDYSDISVNMTDGTDGYSDNLLCYGENIYLWIGNRRDEEYRLHSYVEIYKKENDNFVLIDEYFINGSYSNEYKTFLIDYEENLFGFSVDDYKENSKYIDSCYILLQFDENGINNVDVIEECNYSRAYLFRVGYFDGYLYISNSNTLIVKKIKE